MAVVLYALVLLMAGLDAYDVARVPIVWIAQVGMLAGAAYLWFRRSIVRPAGDEVAWLFLGWMAAVTLLSSVVTNSSGLMPPAATTGYGEFILLRGLTIVIFIAAIYNVTTLLHNGLAEQLTVATIVVGVVIAIAALYIYFGELHGFPEPPRTRLGTSGTAPITNFTYDFRRATGTFREPSLLAAYLTAPFVMSALVFRRLRYPAAIAMSATILLSGSLSAILGLALAAVALAPLAQRSRLGARGVALAGGVAIAAMVMFYALAVSNTGRGVNLFATLGNRIVAILRGGIAGSDRNYVYDFVVHNRPPIVGDGLGIADLHLTAYLHTNAITSFLSFFVNALYSGGYVGLVLAFVLVAVPVLRLARSVEARRDTTATVLFAAYVAWLAILLVTLEELSVMFAVVMAFLAHRIAVLEHEPTRAVPAFLRLRGMPHQ